MKHRSKVIEPGTYGMSPNVIAKVGAFIGDTARAIGDKNHSIEDSSDPVNNEAAIKVYDADTDYVATGGATAMQGIENSADQGGFFSKLVCFSCISNRSLRCSSQN